MGLDLRLILPFACEHHKLPSSLLAVNALDLDRNYAVFDQIENSRDSGLRQVCKPQRMPPGFKLGWYGDEGLQYRDDNPYGDKLTWVTAGELAKVKLRGKDWQTSKWNEAVFTMLKALPPDTFVVLWWH